MTIHGPADGWVTAPDGRKFWGKAGAAGLLVIDPEDRVLLQHRVAWSHFGGTWGIPGGARQFGESAVDGAIRESVEEAAVPADALRLLFSSVVDLEFWSYTTVVARADHSFEPVISDAESEALAWVPIGEVSGLELHPGFAASWSRLSGILRPLHLVVDSANVVGSRPDGWWADRAAATDRLRSSLEDLATAGVPAGLLGAASPRSAEPDVSVWWPEITLVVEGQAKAAHGPAPGSRVELLRSDRDRDGDQAIVDHVASVGGQALTVVVTADRELSARVAELGAEVVGPSTLLGLLA